MADEPPTGEIFGVPYNFEKPSVRRLVSSYWQPDEGMLVRKPFGVGYTLNLADWRSWVVLAVAGLLLLQQRRGGEDREDREDGPVEVVVD